MFKQMQWVRLVKIGITAIPCVVFVYLALQYIGFSGKLSLEYDFSREYSAISPWTPVGRSLSREQNQRTGLYHQRIIGEPVYMTVNVPRSFDTVDVTVQYNNTRQPLTEFGIVTSEDPYATRLYAFQSQVIDEAIDQVATGEWFEMRNDAGQTLLQRKKIFTSIEDFIQHPPTQQSVATYRTSLPIKYIDPIYEPRPDNVVIEQPLRGQHEFFIYIKNESLHATFDIVDLNTEDGADPVTVRLFSADTLLQEQELNDDGITDASGHASTPRSITLDQPNLPEGVYRIVIAANHDTVIQRIQTAQQKFVAKGAVYLYSQQTEPSTLFIQQKQLFTYTEHTEGLQSLSVNDETIHIDEINAPVYWTPDQSNEQVVQLHIPKSNVVIRSSGYTAFTQDSFFDPDYAIAPLNDSTTLAQLDYIFYEDYTPPIEHEGYYSQTVHMSLDGVAGDRKTLLFVLSPFGIDRHYAELDIKQVQFDFHRTPLYKRL